MLHILTIAVRKNIHVCICNLKQSNIETQRECVSKKGVNLVDIFEGKIIIKGSL